MILHYSLAILSTNDNALSLLFFANAPMSGYEATQSDWHGLGSFASSHNYTLGNHHTYIIL